MFQEFFPILEGAPMGGLWLLLIGGALAMGVWMLVLWFVHYKLENAGVMDAGWVSGLTFLGVFYAIKADGYAPRRWLIGMMVLVWGARLSWQLLSERILGGQAEDPGFTALRERWQRWTGLRLLVSFEVRALLAVLLSVPFALLAVDPLQEITVYEWGGFGLWLVAFGGEWKSDSSFFAWLVWPAFFVAALATPFGGWTILCPLLMLFPWLKRRI
jgi:steroid 5-alpha reductase family enzyme